jgi:hypothetical protein
MHLQLQGKDMSSIDDIQSRKLALTPDPWTEENPHRPEVRIWADDGDEEDANPNVTLSLGALFGQGSRFLEMTPDEARTLAVLEFLVGKLTMNATQESTMDWQPIETAPKDGTAILLLFPGGKHIQTRGSSRKRVEMDERICIGKWWTREDAFKQVGKVKSETGARGALLARYGGYWGGAGRKSKPMAGQPTHWQPDTVEDEAR